MLKKLILFLCIVGLIVAGVYWLALKENTNGNQISDVSSDGPLHVIENKQGGQFKTLTAQEFSDLYNGFAYPNTRQIINDFSITGDEEADKVIYRLAEDAGYRIRSAPVADNFVDIGSNRDLQRLAAESWKNLVKEANTDDVELRVTEAFRSAEDQNRIFASRLGNISSDKIIDGSSDDAIRELLKTTAPPGYSRHHSGYTVDLACDSDASVLFENSTCFEWIKKDNYINIKKFGWIPSYPEGIKKQGPEPESWEYVWVGTDALKE
ncbi:MAG TPA: D-alanyl-D-alanine carboxypeptidase family protein [Candidatus Saccharimonadales bacterium]|nr:D-alanyl-D-alanine carboxypeptidase family protein [Candidatus Saccharimonadales bacterium]